MLKINLKLKPPPVERTLLKGELEVGDEIVFVNKKYSDNNYTLGRTYTVEKIIHNGFIIKDDLGKSGAWAYNFVLKNHVFKKICLI